MKLIADSGSTKTDWAVVNGGNTVCRIVTQGINPVHQTRKEIEQILSCGLVPHLDGCGISGIYFYGAGCLGSRTGMMREILAGITGCAATKTEVTSDLTGAARALCGNRQGIACILGTGANSCVFDGEKITANIPPLGYILGDEGSGAVLGRMFLNALLRGRLPAEMREDYLSQTGLTYEDIINKVYRQPMANRFLASASIYIGNHIRNAALQKIVKDNFRNFFRNNIAGYGRQDLAVGAVGGIAYCYHELLAEVAGEEGFVMGRILKSPMDGLIRFHCRQQE